MNFREIEARLDQNLDEILQQAPPERRHLAETVLQATRRAIITVLRQFPESSLTTDNISDICAVLDTVPLVHIPQVLENVGLPNLERDILERRRAIKWQFLGTQLRSIIAPGERFTQRDIGRRDYDLYKAIKVGLLQEIDGEGELDWRLLQPRLPEDLRELYSPVNLSNEERRRFAAAEARRAIRDYKLHEVIAILGRNNPRELRHYLDLIGVAASDQMRDRITYVAFSGIRNNELSRMDKVMANCDETLENFELLNEIPIETANRTVTISARIPDGARELMIRGPWTDDIKIESGNDREITFEVPLKLDRNNEIHLIAHDYDFRNGEVRGQRSRRVTLNIEQTLPDDTDDLADMLRLLAARRMGALREDEGKRELFMQFLEGMTIKRFAASFEEGERYIENFKRDQRSRSAHFAADCLDEIQRKFRHIQRMQFPGLRLTDENGRPLNLTFFQKYSVFKAREMIQSGIEVIILASEPGLGKTATALAIAHDFEPLIVCPNQAVSTWLEEQSMWYLEQFLRGIGGMGTVKSINMLNSRNVPGAVVNVELLRYSEGKSGQEAKLEAMNRRHHPERQRMTIIDEAHFLKNDTQQSEGYTRLESDVDLLLTASPWREPAAVRALMAKVLPNDERFRNAAAFHKAFPSNDPRAMRALYVLMQRYVIRFLKKDVLPTFDPNRPLEEQHGLPAKEHIDPITTGVGSYTLSPDQENAILEFFEDWPRWHERYERFLPRGGRAQEEGLRQPDDSLSKIHALRYIMNHPMYIDSTAESPKLREAMRILDSELAEGHKVLVFCRYLSQIQHYAQLLRARGIQFALYHGDMNESIPTDNKGYKVDEHGRKIKYRRTENQTYFLRDGRPVVARRGERSSPILATDYERLVFQNDPNVRVCLSTYQSGAQSLTLTAADAMIKDDIPEDATQEYQAENRIHRIDNNRKKYRVRYYTLAARYSPEFLRRMRNQVTQSDRDTLSAYSRWFEQGTYHEVQLRRLAVQRVKFEILNNGIAEDPDLAEEEENFRLI